MPVKTLYFDEAGFTGYNLLDPTQPVFVVASTDVDAVTAESILRDSFPRYRGAEFKFSNIWRSRNKGRLVEFAGHLRELDGHAFSWMIDKRFGVLSKVVDFLIEPTVTDAGYDFYSDGFCWKYANYIHFGLTQFGAPELYDSLLTAYQTFSRNPSPRRLRNFKFQLELMASSSEEPLRVFFEQMALGATLFNKYNDLQTFKKANDLQVTSVLAVIGHWRTLYCEDFAVVHDASSNFFRHQGLWERMTNSNVPAQMHPIGDGTSVEFPLRVISTLPTDSVVSYPIQFCDMLAGLTTRHFNPRLSEKDLKLMEDVVDAGLGEIECNGIKQSPIFPDQIPPRRLTGPNAVDRMTKIIYGPHNDKI